MVGQKRLLVGPILETPSCLLKRYFRGLKVACAKAPVLKQDYQAPSNSHPLVDDTVEEWTTSQRGAQIRVGLTEIVAP